MKNIKKLIFGAASFLAPVAVFAQGPGAPTPQGGTSSGNLIAGLLSIAKKTLDTIIPIIIVLGVIYFIWAVIQYVTVKDEEERGKARSHMIMGLIALFVIVSIWGLIGFIATTTGVGQGGNVPLPNVPCTGPYC